MKFERTPQFDADVRGLSDHEYQLFRRIAHDLFSPACDVFAADPGKGWPKKLRIKDIKGTKGIFEMTWSFAGPDGRATFEWVTVSGERRVRWRRIGGHRIFRNP